MSLTAVLPYFRDCLCSMGLEEWKSEIASESPPSTILHKAFKLEVGNILADPVKHTSFLYRMPVTVVLYEKTYKNPIEGVDALIAKVEEANCCLLEVTKRYGTIFKSIEPESINFEPIDVTNDNALKAVMDFNVQLIVEYRN